MRSTKVGEFIWPVPHKMDTNQQKPTPMEFQCNVNRNNWMRKLMEVDEGWRRGEARDREDGKLFVFV